MKKTAEPQAPELKKPEPELPVNSFGEYFAQMTWDHNCKKPGCYGRGHIGVVVTEVKTEDGKLVQTNRRIQPCSCLKYNPNGPYVELMKRLEEFDKGFAARMDHNFTNQAALFQFMKDKFFILENLSLTVRAFRLWDKIFGKKRSTNDPVTGPEKKSVIEPPPQTPIETDEVPKDH
jgi:hypothetical protein